MRAGSIQHPQYGPVNVEYTHVDEVGNGEVYATLDVMRRYALEDAGIGAIQRDAAAVREMASRSGGRLSDAVWRYVRDRVRFVRDEELVASAGSQLMGTDEVPVIEVLVRPVDMSGGGVARRLGDCDDFSMWAASILVALGVPCSFVVMAGDRRDADRFSHVYVAAYENGERVAIDASHGTVAGWESPNYLGLREEVPVYGIGGQSWVWVAMVLAGVWVWRGLIGKKR
jgi:hypothetical protein